MPPYLGPWWINSCQIWCVKVVCHVLWNMVTKHFGALYSCSPCRVSRKLWTVFETALECNRYPKVVHCKLSITMPVPSTELCAIACYCLFHYIYHAYVILLLTPQGKHAYSYLIMHWATTMYSQLKMKHLKHSLFQKQKQKVPRSYYLYKLSHFYCPHEG